MYLESHMDTDFRISPILVATTGITYYMLTDQEQQRSVPIVLRTIVNAQDTKILQMRN